MDLGLERSDDGEILGEDLAGVEQHVGSGLASTLILRSGVSPVEGGAPDGRSRISRVVAVAVGPGVPGPRGSEASAGAQVPALLLGRRGPVGKVDPTPAAHDEEAD